MEQTQQNFDKAREAFPRFYLLSDEDLKVALSAPIKEAIQVTEQIFQAAHVWKFTESGDVSGFFGKGADPSDQVIQFLEPVKQGDDRVAFFAQLHAAMVARVKHDMHAQIAQNEWSVDKKPVGIAEAVLIADEVFYCKMAEEAITTGGLYVALDEITEMVNKLIDHSLVEKSAGMQRLHNGRLVLALTWKRRISQLTAGSCRQLDLFFKSFCRFYFENDGIVCKTAEASFAKIGEHQLHHQYEYQGMCDLLVVTQLTEKLNFNYAEALGTGKGHVALGPAGTGKTETAKDFAKKLGRQMVVICCSDEDKLIGIIKNTFEAARHGSVWMCLDEFNRIPKENLDSLLKHFASDHLPKCAPGRFITQNPGYAGRTFAEFDSQEWMVNHMSVPSVNEIAQNMLAVVGFRSYEEMATRLMKWQYNSIWKMSKAAQYDFGLRKVKQIISCAAGRFRKNGETEETAMINAIAISMGAALLPEDHKIHEQIMTAVGFEMSGYVRPMNAKATHPTFPKEQFQHLCACFALIAEQRHALQIRGHGHKFVEAIAEAENYHVVTIDLDSGPEKDNFSWGWNNGESKYGHEFSKKMVAKCSGSVGAWLYGVNDYGVWREGALPKALKEVTSGETSKKQGLKLVHIKSHHLDPEIVEPLNSLFDDNKKLILANGEVLALPNDVRIVCEVADFKNVTPAHVARTAIIHFACE